MKFTEIAFLLVMLLAASQPCAGQYVEPPVHSFKIQKKELTLEEAATRIFYLFCREALDTLMDEFLPDKDTALAICNAGKMEQNDLCLSLLHDYGEFRKQVSTEIRENIQKIKEEKVPYGTYEVERIGVPPEVQAEVEGGKMGFISLRVFCSGQSDTGIFKDVFRINPLFYYKGKWYIFDTELGFSRD